MRRFPKSVVAVPLDLIGDVFCPNRECSNAGTQRKCEYLRKNRIQEYIYKCWDCSAIVQVVNVPFAEQQLIFKLPTGTGIYLF